MGALVECKTETDEKIYIVKEDLPDSVIEGDSLFEDKNGKIRMNEIEIKRRKISKKYNI